MSKAQTVTIRYSRDKPKECRYCYYWGRERHGCMLGGPENCYYRLPEVSGDGARVQCGGCPYGRVFPCIGWCTVKVMEAVLEKKREDSHEFGKEVISVAGDSSSEEQELHNDEQLSSAG